MNPTYQNLSAKFEQLQEVLNDASVYDLCESYKEYSEHYKIDSSVMRQLISYTLMSKHPENWKKWSDKGLHLMPHVFFGIESY